MELVIKLLDSLTPYGTYSYVLMFLILLGCGFGFPMPEDIILITGGALSARGVVTFETTFIVCMAGVLIGDGTIFYIGHSMGPKVKKTRFYKKIISENREKTVARWFKEHGDKVIFFARFLPGLRMPLFLTSGIYHVPFWKFLALDGFAALISVPVWIWVGHLFGENLETLAIKIKQLQMGYLGGTVVLILFVILVVYLKNKFKKVAHID